MRPAACYSVRPTDGRKRKPVLKPGPVSVLIHPAIDAFLARKEPKENKT